MAEQGLKNRARSDGAGGDETQFLAYLQQIVADGSKPGGRLVDKFHESVGRRYYAKAYIKNMAF
jgi:gamma-glutamylcysteine synthetase